jgi:hypothetical protein
VIRRFGGKAQLIVAVAERGLARIAEARAEQPTADPAITVRDLVGHYGVWGALILKVYSEAPHIAGMPLIAAAGRRYHVDWCRAAFDEHLPADLDAETRTRRIAQVVTICDATTWRILHDDFGLADDQIERALVEMITPVLAAPS